MKNELLKRRYYRSINGKVDELALSINCYEKILYQSIIPYDIDHKFVFCDDTNLLCSRDGFSIWRNSLNLNDKLFTTNEIITSDVKKAEKEIQNRIDTGFFIAIQTMIDLLPPYIWYKEDSIGEKSTHLTLIVGVNNENYFFTDVPQALNPKCLKLHPLNNSIFQIEKTVVHRAIEKYCRLITIDINECYLDHVYNLSTILYSYVQNYGLNYEDAFIGRGVLMALIKNDDMLEHAQVNFFNDWYNVYLLMKRKEILLQCINDSMHGIEVDENTLVKLALSIERWRVLTNVIHKFLHKSVNIPLASLREHLIILLSIEDELVDAVSTFLNSSQYICTPHKDKGLRTNNLTS